MKKSFEWLSHHKKLGNKGIAIVGVLTAGAIALIILAGTTQMLLQLTSRIGQQEDLAKRKLFHNWLAVTLQDPTACKNTLAGYEYTSPPPTDYDVGEIRNDVIAGGGEVLMDFYDDTGDPSDDVIAAESKKRLADEFGISNFGQLKFANFDSSTQKAELVLYTKSKLHGTIPIYNKNLTLSLTGVTLSGGTPNRVTACSVDSASLDAIMKCLRVYGNLALVGCGATTEGTGAESTAYGHNAGNGSSTGGKNTFIGVSAGAANTTGEENTFVGDQAGTANTTGSENIFFGSEAGKSNTTGGENAFVGSQAGMTNDTGMANTFVGYQAGHFNSGAGNNNVFVGSQAGMNNTGSGNTFIGRNAGAANTSGNENIFIGNEAANLTAYQTLSNQFVLGNNTNRGWIVGAMGGDNLQINSKRVCLRDGPTSGINCPSVLPIPPPPSSRVYKKNIKEFKDFDKSLGHIVRTPLFTYQYKKNHPEKSRMGVISEELPESLQIKVKGAPSLPDWPSVYGTLWAGMKAFSQKLTSFKMNILKKMTEEKLLFSKDFTHFKKQFLLKFKAQSKKSTLAFHSLKNDWNSQFTGKAESQLKVFKGEISYFKNWFEKTESRLKGVEGLKKEADFLSKAHSSYKENIMEQQKQLLSEKIRMEETEQALSQAKGKLKKRKEALATATKRLSEIKAKLLKNQIKDKEQFKSYDQKFKQLEGKLKSSTASNSS